MSTKMQKSNGGKNPPPTDRSGKTAAVNPRRKAGPGGNDPRKKKEPPEIAELKAQIETMKTNIENLEQSVRLQQEELDTYKTENQDLSKQLTQFVMEKANKSRDQTVSDLNKQLENLQKKVDISEKENAEIAANRDLYMNFLSQYIAEKTPEDTPDIPNIDQHIKPTTLAEMYNKIYQGDWPKAYEIANEKFNDEKLSCQYLFKILKDAWEFCCALSRHQLQILEMIFLVPHGPNMSVESSYNVPKLSIKNLKIVKETRKRTAKQTIANLYGLFISPESGSEMKDIPTELEPFVRSCLEVCWYCAIHDPPLSFVFDTGVSWELDSNQFDMFTKTGVYVDFIVWPALLLYEHGPVLQKGYAQALDEKSHRPQQ